MDNHNDNHNDSFIGNGNGNDNDTPPDRPSKSQRKRDAHRIRHMADALAALPPGHLQQIALTDEVRAALRDAHQMRADSARGRLLARIAKLMRRFEPDQIAAIDNALADRSPQYRHRQR